MRRTVLALGLVLLAGCSSGGTAPVPSTTSTPNSTPSSTPSSTPTPTKTLTVDERLRATLLTPATVSRIGATAINNGSRFDVTENTTYSFVTGCGARFRGDSRIDGEWQGSFYDRDDDGVDGDQVAVHYRLGAAAALAEIRRKLACAKPLTRFGPAAAAASATASANDVFVSCQESRADSVVTCRLVAADGDIALAVTLTATSPAPLIAAVGTLAPAMRLSVAGRQPTTSAAPSSSSAAVPTAQVGQWSKAVARERLTTMLKDRQVAYVNRSIAARLRYGSEPVYYSLTPDAETAASYDRTVLANLGAGRWPDSAAAVIAALRSALTTEARAYAAASLSPTVAVFRTLHARTLSAVAATDRAITAARTALAGP